MFFANIFIKIRNAFSTMFKKSAPCVKRRLKEVIASDRLALPSSVVAKLQQSIQEVLTLEMGPCELLCAVTGKSQNGNTELVVNITVSQRVNSNAA